jgi:hypothetical protein
MSPLPFGLKQGGLYNVNTVVEYRKSFLANLRPNKTELLYLSYLNKLTSDSRINVPAAGKRVSLPEFFDGMAHSKYVLSPNGMKPECYRHYEAIGLGTVPVTELNPAFSWHLNGSVIYNNTNWEMDYLQEALPKYSITVNRNMILEEYWIEYMEKEVKRGPLFWWDRHAQRRSPLDEFITNFTEPVEGEPIDSDDDDDDDSSSSSED